MLSAWGVCLHTASCKGWCLENADMELTIMLLPIKFARGRTEEVQRRQGFCPWAEEISFLISLISFSWWWLATLWNINPPLYNLPSFYPTIWQSLSLLLLLSLPQWNNDAVQANDNVPLWVYTAEKEGNGSPLENPLLLTQRWDKSMKIKTINALVFWFVFFVVFENYSCMQATCHHSVMFHNQHTLILAHHTLICR